MRARVGSRANVSRYGQAVQTVINVEATTKLDTAAWATVDFLYRSRGAAVCVVLALTAQTGWRRRTSCRLRPRPSRPAAELVSPSPSPRSPSPSRKRACVGGVSAMANFVSGLQAQAARPWHVAVRLVHVQGDQARARPGACEEGEARSHRSRFVSSCPAIQRSLYILRCMCVRASAERWPARA